MNTPTFIDLFAGIGGSRIGFEAAGSRAVFSSEWDKFAQQTYTSNFGDFPDGDITCISANDIPAHDILVAGFPCQPFSLAGVSKLKSLGRQDGFRNPSPLHVSSGEYGKIFREPSKSSLTKNPNKVLIQSE